MAGRTQPLTPEFLEEEVNIRGIPYRLRELSIGDYDELVKKATTKIANPLTGQEDESIDNSVLLKMMVLKCAVDPKLTPESLANLPMRVVLKLNLTVNKMHYGDEPEKKPEPAADAAEETPKGNA